MTPAPRTDPLLGTLAYMVALVAILVAPTGAPHASRGYLSDYQLTPGRRVVADITVNVALFVPLGWGLHRAGRRRGRPRRRLMLAVGIAAVTFSLLMETLQFWLPGRYSSIVDVAMNGAGALLGAWLDGHAAGRG